jgi:hypothetical protein
MGWTSWTKGVVSSALGGGKDKSCVPTPLSAAHAPATPPKGQRTPAATRRTHPPSLYAFARFRKGCARCAAVQPCPRSPDCAATRARWEPLTHPTNRHLHHTQCVPAGCSTCLRPAAAAEAPAFESGPGCLGAGDLARCTLQPRAHHYARVTSIRRLAHALDASVAYTPRGLPQRRQCGLPMGETGSMHPHVFGAVCAITLPWLGQPHNETPPGHPGGVGRRRP